MVSNCTSYRAVEVHLCTLDSKARAVPRLIKFSVKDHFNSADAVAAYQESGLAFMRTA